MPIGADRCHVPLGEPHGFHGREIGVEQPAERADFAGQRADEHITEAEPAAAAAR
jgi:hypothetical protein